MTHYVVINGDDGGLHPDTDTALLRSAETGVLSSASVVANGPTCEDFVRRAHDLDLGIGLHVNLTSGRPLTHAPSLVDAAGFFRRTPGLKVWEPGVLGAFDPHEVNAEVAAQWARLASLAGRLDHVDGHNHVHIFEPVASGVAAVLRDSARDDAVYVRVSDEPECDTPLRPALPPGAPSASKRRTALIASGLRFVDRFVGYLFSHRPDIDGVAHLANDKTATTEWMVHPGNRPASDFTESPCRRRELETLCDPDLRRRLDDWGYRVVRFGDLP